MALKDMRRAIHDYVLSESKLIETNQEKQSILEGQLMPLVDKIMRESLSPTYYNSIKNRIIPINILPRVINKISKAYRFGVTRTTELQSDQELIDFYVEKYSLNQKMETADEYTSLFKAYSIEPQMDKIRVYPFDRFLVMSLEGDDCSYDVYIKMVGKKFIKDKNTYANVYYTYTADEFDAFDENLDTYKPALVDNGGVNPYGVIPMVYGKRSETRLIPIQDDDILQIVKVLPVILSDMGGALFYQAFTILYGIDINLDNLTISPNAIWEIKSDLKSEKNPQIGQITPSADVHKVISFVTHIFTMWLETKGIRVGSIGEINGAGAANGISKIIDEMDVTEYVSKSQGYFVRDEKELWAKMKVMHNYWVDHSAQFPDVIGMPKFSETFKVNIKFAEPEIKKSMGELITEASSLMDKGLISRRGAMRMVFPDMTEEEVNVEILAIDGENTVEIENQDDDGENIQVN